MNYPLSISVSGSKVAWVAGPGTLGEGSALIGTFTRSCLLAPSFSCLLGSVSIEQELRLLGSGEFGRLASSVRLSHGVELECLLHGAPGLSELSSLGTTSTLTTGFGTSELHESTPAALSDTSSLLLGASRPLASHEVVGSRSSALRHHPAIHAREPPLVATFKDCGILHSTPRSSDVALSELREPVGALNTREPTRTTRGVLLASLAGSALAETVRCVESSSSASLCSSVRRRRWGSTSITCILNSLRSTLSVASWEGTATILSFLETLSGPSSLPGLVRLGLGGGGRLPLCSVTSTAVSATESPDTSELTSTNGVWSEASKLASALGGAESGGSSNCGQEVPVLQLEAGSGTLGELCEPSLSQLLADTSDTCVGFGMVGSICAGFVLNQSNGSLSTCSSSS